MTSLNQLLGVLDGVKNRTDKAITGLHRIAGAAYSGISGIYAPMNDDAIRFPAESTLVQVRGTDVLKAFRAAMTELIDTVATVDTTNQQATANIVLADGTVVAEDVPAITLLFLEKKIEEYLRTFVSKLPVLDPSEQWIPGPDGLWRTPPVDTFKMDKVRLNHVLYEATEKHPAQVEMYTKDLPVGTWTRIKSSGAFQVMEITDTLNRIDLLLSAVRFARVKANEVDVADRKIASDILDYVFNPLNSPA